MEFYGSFVESCLEEVLESTWLIKFPNQELMILCAKSSSSKSASNNHPKEMLLQKKTGLNELSVEKYG